MSEERSKREKMLAHGEAINKMEELEQLMEAAGYMSGDSAFDHFMECKQSLGDDFDKRTSEST